MKITLPLLVNWKKFIVSFSARQNPCLMAWQQDKERLFYEFFLIR